MYGTFLENRMLKNKIQNEHQLQSFNNILKQVNIVGGYKSGKWKSLGNTIKAEICKHVGHTSSTL